MYQVARLPDRVKALEFIDSVPLVDEFARSIRQELDYRAEARNAEQFGRNFEGHPRVRSRGLLGLLALARPHARVPRGLRSCATSTPRSTRCRAAPQLAYPLAEAWMTMIFRHGLFHADPHPANVLVLGSGDRSASSTSAPRAAPDDDLLEVDGALHRGREPELEALPRRLPRSASATRRSVRRSSSPSCATSSTATTARAWPRSTRSRSSARPSRSSTACS